MSEKVEGNKKRITEVATISAGDSEIGDLIAEVIEKIGKDGVVTVEEGRGLSMESEVVEGFTFDRGFVSPYMVTDSARMETVYSHPAIVVTDKKVSSIQEFLPFLEKLAQAGKKDLVLIAEEVEGEALTTLVLNKLKGVFNAVAIKAPKYGDQKTNVLEDIATLTGAKVISDAQGMTFENSELDVVGSARKVIVTKDDTTIIEGTGNKTGVKSRISQLDSQIITAENDFDKNNLRERRASLSGKVAVIKVGGATETEIEEKKYRVDDAVAAVKAALADGVVPGGGVTLINLAKTIKVEGNDSVAVGAQILKNALEQPFRILLNNAGLNADEWLPKVRAAQNGFGVDLIEGNKLVDLKKKGIVDPVRVTLEAIQSSVSIAATASTMGALVVEIPKNDKNANEQNPGMNQMM